MYEQLGAEIGRLVEEKQKCYGDSFSKSGAVLRVLYPEGISLEQLDDALCIVRIVDKLFRIATDRDALGESPYKDIVGYGLLGAARCEKPRDIKTRDLCPSCAKDKVTDCGIRQDHPVPECGEYVALEVEALDRNKKVVSGRVCAHCALFGTCLKGEVGDTSRKACYVSICDTCAKANTMCEVYPQEWGDCGQYTAVKP